jgi:hypothetical protein
MKPAMTLATPARIPPMTDPTTTGMTSTNAAVDTLMCERRGNIANRARAHSRRRRSNRRDVAHDVSIPRVRFLGVSLTK